MTDPSNQASRPLPPHPNLRHLRDQAKELVRSGDAATLAQAQFRIARLYGFASWPKLKARVDSLHACGQLKQAIDSNDFEEVKRLMTRDPGLHTAPLGYGQDGPLTWVAECRIPWEPPVAVRLEMAQWMIDHGSDVHQGGDGPLMRAALAGYRIPMMELLVANGADVNAEWHGCYPIVFAPCESVDAVSLGWLLARGANPNCARPGRTYPDSALDFLIGAYVRSEQFPACIDLLLGAGAASRRNISPVLDLLRQRVDNLAGHLARDPELARARFAELDFGGTACRRLTLAGATLLHVAAEFPSLAAARLLVDAGADVNARAALDPSGVGGQTAIFHAATQFGDIGLQMVEFLVENGADLTLKARLPGHAERPEEFVECTALGYASLFPGTENRTVEYLRARAGSSS